MAPFLFYTVHTIIRSLKSKVMKQIFTLLTILGICGIVLATTVTLKNKNTADTKPVVNTDTIGLAQFQTWKMQQQLALAQQEIAPKPATKVVYVSKPVARKSQTGYMKTTTQNAAKAPEKKGWSKAAKATAIGAGAGAVIGGVVNKKNRAVGAAIGGVLGGGIGYGIGRSMDKKDGRY
jgi:hypothetical protein